MSEVHFIAKPEPGFAAKFIADTILSHLHAGERVLWFVSGGSAITVAVEMSNYLRLQPHQGLAVMLTDERFGTVGHPDSNWEQLLKAGFALPEATLFPVLNGSDRLNTTTHFAHLLERELTQAQYTIGLFGIGADGHTAGILPQSTAANSTDLAHGYGAGKFERITITPRTIAKLDEAVVFAVGKEKWPTLALLNQDATIEEQPAQALKQVSRLTIFSNYSNQS